MSFINCLTGEIFLYKQTIVAKLIFSSMFCLFLPLQLWKATSSCNNKQFELHRKQSRKHKIPHWRIRYFATEQCIQNKLYYNYLKLSLKGKKNPREILENSICTILHYYSTDEIVPYLNQQYFCKSEKSTQTLFTPFAQNNNSLWWPHHSISITTFSKFSQKVWKFCT